MNNKKLFPIILSFVVVLFTIVGVFIFTVFKEEKAGEARIEQQKQQDAAKGGPSPAENDAMKKILPEGWGTNKSPQSTP